jgi:peptide/nickel transport system permease protein
LLVIASFHIGLIIMVEAALSYLGVGVPLPTPSWGNMVSDGQDYLGVAWWLTAIPGIAITLNVLSWNILGDWLRDTLDPRLAHD